MLFLHFLFHYFLNAISKSPSKNQFKFTRRVKPLDPPGKVSAKAQSFISTKAALFGQNPAVYVQKAPPFAKNAANFGNPRPWDKSCRLKNCSALFFVNPIVYNVIIGQ